MQYANRSTYMKSVQLIVHVYITVNAFQTCISKSHFQPLVVFTPQYGLDHIQNKLIELWPFDNCVCAVCVYGLKRL